MLRKEVPTQRPERWDVPFDERMTPEHVDRLLQIPPFSQMLADHFPAGCSLRGILQNDVRVVEFQPGDLIVREGEYGNSAFMLVEGSVCVTLDHLSAELLGRPAEKALAKLARHLRLFRRSRFPEVRRAVTSQSPSLGSRHDGPVTRIFLQDVPGILRRHRTLRLKPGEYFGEVAALARTPRSATVFAESPARLIEIRWQGLRDLMRYDGRLREHIDRLYRQNNLSIHLRETPLFSRLDKAQVRRLVDSTEFETYGNFEWNRIHQQLAQATFVDRLEAEPLIAQEGNIPNGLLLIRNGFARVSQIYGHGHRTSSYLGKGQLFGLEELSMQWQSGQPVPLQSSLRAIGYVDILRIPTHLVEEFVLAKLSRMEQRDLQHRYAQAASNTVARAASQTGQPAAATRPLETSMLEFIVDQRLMNGTQAMVINLDRCTRCDDCVRACAETHDNNPRFVREGPTFARNMFVSACMHCVDPVCMIGCPTGAIHRDQRTGNILIHDGSCIGCSTCANSCPYQAIKMVQVCDPSGKLLVDDQTAVPLAKATKCDLCTGLLGGPACQRACPHDALVRIDLTQPDRLADWLGR